MAEKFTQEALQFGAMLAKYRTLQPGGKKLTQAEAADLCGIPYNTYRKYEQGVFIPDISRVLSLGFNLNIPPAELLSTAYPEYMDYFSRLSAFPYPIPAELSNELLKTISIDTYKDDSERWLRLMHTFCKYVLKETNIYHA